jgi:hypothetical protein
MAQAVVTHRSNQEPSEADVLARADDQQFGVLGLVGQHGSNFPARELHQPIRPGIHLVEDPGDPPPVAGFDLIMRQQPAGYARGCDISIVQPIRPIEDVHGPQHAARQFGVFGRPLQCGSA